MRSMFALVLLGMLSLALPAQALVLILDGDDKLTGAQDVVVLGNLYDVSFAGGSCAAVFDGCDQIGDFDFDDNPTALAAAQALADQVFVDGPQGNFDTVLATLATCDDNPNVRYCFVDIPHGVYDADAVSVTVFRNAANVSAGDRVYSGGKSRDDVSSTASFARFTLTGPADVPAPGALTLLPLALGLLALRRRR